jgi:hypothetical protein
MDAGIIAAFKKRYRSFQLGLALDREMNGHQDIYKIDILQAMFWCRDAWKMISPLTIKNCFFHTGLFDKSATAIDDNLEETEADEVDRTLAEQIAELATNSMPLEEFISKDDDFEVHHEYDESDILADCLGDESDTDDVVEIVPDQPEITLGQKIGALQITIEILNENALDNLCEIRTLRRLLSRLSNEQREEKQKSLKQVDIRSYFK